MENLKGSLPSFCNDSARVSCVGMMLYVLVLENIALKSLGERKIKESWKFFIGVAQYIQLWVAIKAWISVQNTKMNVRYLGLAVRVSIAA